VALCAVVIATHLILTRAEYSAEEVKKFNACLGTDLEAKFKPCMMHLLKCFSPKDSSLNEACAKAECKTPLDWKRVDSCAKQAHGAKSA